MPYGLIDLVLRDARLRSLLSMRSIFYLVLRRAKPVSKEGRRARGFLQAPCQPPPLRISLTMLPYLSPYGSSEERQWRSLAPWPVTAISLRRIAPKAVRMAVHAWLRCSRSPRTAEGAV